jgi:hypothetical protein
MAAGTSSRFLDISEIIIDKKIKKICLPGTRSQVEVKPGIYYIIIKEKWLSHNLSQLQSGLHVLAGLLLLLV